jgi:hypothetical protein
MNTLKEQREAIVRTLDTLARSSVIGGVLGYTGLLRCPK